MKLRVHKNSIRLRLSQSEVKKIGQGQPIVEILEIGVGQQGHFSYSLIPVEEENDILADYGQNNLKVIFPKQLAIEWASTDRVSLSNQMDNGLSILIEKDFQCLHRRPGEDEADNFRNPLAG